MADRYQLLTEIYLTAIAELIDSAENWRRFLSAAGRHYQLPFADQVLIYAQRPQASKVMTMRQWNEKGYWIRRGSKGIAVFEQPLAKRAIRYYFDVTDTYVGKGYQGEPLVTLDLNEQEKGDITGSFRRRNQKITRFAQAISYGAGEVAEQAVAHYQEGIVKNVLADRLDRQLEQQAKQAFQKLLADSVTHLLLARLEPESLAQAPAESLSVFASITQYQTLQAVNTLGVCLSYASKNLLKEILHLQKQAQAKFAQTEQFVYSESSKTNPTKELHLTQQSAQTQPPRQGQQPALTQDFERSVQNEQQLNIP